MIKSQVARKNQKRFTRASSQEKNNSYKPKDKFPDKISSILIIKSIVNMQKYPAITDDTFYRFINQKYAKYKISNEKRTLQDICFPKKYQLQIPQKFLSEFINPETPYRGILVYHRIGGGKTCAAINICENFKKNSNIIIVLPASLKGNFRSELRSLCAGSNYLTDAEREKLKKYQPSDPEYKEIIRQSDLRIDKVYTIYSYNKFINLLTLKKIHLENTLLVIDEIHNMISEKGTYYTILSKALRHKPQNFRLVIMSATPIFDKPTEIALTMNLLIRPKMPTGHDFIRKFISIRETSKGPVYSTKYMNIFKKMIRGYVSYYRGAPPYVYPSAEIKYVNTKMSNKQLRLYNKIMKHENVNVHNYLEDNISNSFFIGTRMVSNFVYPNMKIGKIGFDSLVDSDFSSEKLSELSPKFLKIMRKIKKCQGPVFVYSNFKEYGGIRTFARMLEYYGYMNYEFHGSGNKRYGIWSGDQDILLKEEIKAVYNSKDNEYGDKIKVILGSAAVKEGVSFLRVQEVHLLDPYWNMSRIDQIIGRAIRFCSHKDVDKDRRLVKVYIYLAVHPSIPMSVDQKIMQIALKKQHINNEFEHALKEVAIDCHLFHNANVYPGEEPINCVT